MLLLNGEIRLIMILYLDDQSHTPPRKHNESIEMLRSPKSAMNDTQKIKKTKRRVEPETAQHNSTFNLNELKKVSKIY
jgi:hypothetical protein